MCLAMPGRVISIECEDALLRAGRVEFAGIVKQANLVYVPEARIGDYVLVHAGFGIAIIDEADALKTLAYLAGDGSEELI
jgi:hydrogenase expression/formation protein HypC